MSVLVKLLQILSSRKTSLVSGPLLLMGWISPSLGATALALFDRSFVPIPEKEIHPTLDENNGSYHGDIENIGALRVTMKLPPFRLGQDGIKCNLILSEGNDAQQQNFKSFHTIVLTVDRSSEGRTAFIVSNYFAGDPGRYFGLAPKIEPDGSVQFGISQIYPGKISFLFNQNNIMNLDFKYKISSISFWQSNKFCSFEEIKVGSVH